MAKFPVKLKARLLLVRNGEILLLKQTKPNGGNFTLPGGTIESIEFAKETLIRETREEVGIQLTKEDLELAHVLHKKSDKGHRIVFYFKANIFSGRPRPKENDKFSRLEWRSLQALPEKLTPTVASVIKYLRAGKAYSEARL